MNDAQWKYDISLWMAADDYGASFPMPQQAAYSDPNYIWPYEEQAILVIQKNGGTVPPPPQPPPDPNRQAAIEAYDADCKLCDNALIHCLMSLPHPVLDDYLANPAYVWPYRDQAETCPQVTPI